MNRLNIKTLLLIGGGIALPLVAFAQFRGPSAQPVTNNVPGVIWNASGTAATQPNAQMDFTGTNWSLSPTFKSDIGLTHGRAFRVDRAASSTLNFGNWFSGPTPFTLGVYGGLNITSVDAVQSLGRDGRVQAEKFCFAPGAGVNCITAWPSSGGSTAGTTWDARSGAASLTWTSVTYGKGIYAAVANINSGTDAIMTSPDGVNWSIRSLVSDLYRFTSITYGNGMFVAVTNNRIFVTSVDGIAWTPRYVVPLGDGRTWTSITYGNGMFVAVANAGTGNRILTSTDGVTWTTRTSPADNSWTSVTYGNGLFVAVASTGVDNRVMTSVNGIAWTLRSSAGLGEPNWTSVTYGNGLFVAVGNTGVGSRVMTSSNGISWTQRASAADNSWTSVTYGDGMFVAVASSGTGNRVMTSPDGIAWTIRVSAADSTWQSIAYGNGMFVSVGSGATNVMTSGKTVLSLEPINSYFTNGLRSYRPGGRGVEGVGQTGVWGDGEINGTGVMGISQAADGVYGFSLTNTGGSFFGGLYGINVTGKSLFSGDVEVTGDIYSKGLYWTSRTSAANNNWGSVVYGNGLFVAVALTGTGNRVMTSTDGINWTLRTSAADNQWNSITYGNGLFVAVAGTGTGNRVMTSTDGINWTLRTSAADNTWRDVTYGNGMFVAVGMSGLGNRVMTSPDGIVWTLRTSAADNSWNSVTYGNGLFVAVSGACALNNCVMTSPDGATWTIRTSAVSQEWYSVTYGNGLFVAGAITGVGNRIMTSPDGATWILRVTPANYRITELHYANGLFVGISDSAVGNGIITSSNGITWTTRSTPVDNAWVDLTYGNGMFVAVSTNGTGNRVMTSGKMEENIIKDESIFHEDVLLRESRPQISMVADGISSASWVARVYMDRYGTTRAGGLWVAAAQDSVNWFAGAPYNNGSASNQFMLGYDTGSNPHDIDNFRMLLSSAGIPRFSGLISCSGIQTSSAGTMSCSSDATLKDIRGSYTKGLDALRGIEPKVFSWKKGTDLYDNGFLNYGFIAQNVQKTLPEAVTTGADGKLQVGTTQILAASVNAINELREENEALKSKVETLEERLQALERKLK